MQDTSRNLRAFGGVLGFLMFCPLSGQAQELQSAASYTDASHPVATRSVSALYTGASASASLSYLPAGQGALQDITVYNFNDASTSTTDAGPSNTALLLSADRGTGTLTTNFDPDDILSTAGTVINAGANAGNSDPAGAALILRPGFNTTDNNGGNLTLAASTLGYSNIAFSFAAERTSTGFSSNQFQYSLNGTTYTNYGAAFDVPVISHGSNPYAAFQFDLSSITGLSSSTQASFRIVFKNGTDGSGNIRLDNLRLSGAPLVAAPEPGTCETLLIACAVLTYHLKRVRLQHIELQSKDILS